MNISLLSTEIDEIKGLVNIVPYQINKSGKYPFLQYYLLKYLHGQEEMLPDEYVSFLKFNHRDNSNVLDICAAALDILFLSYEDVDPKYEYNGYLFYEGEYYIFFDCSEYNMQTHNLNKQNDIWLTLVDEIINYKMVCQFKIDDKVSQFFLTHPEFIKLQNPESTNYYESPIVAYIGCSTKKRDFLATFGQLPDKMDGLYYFTQFDNVYTDTVNKRSGLIRFAIFAGNMKVMINGKDKENKEENKEEEEEEEEVDWTIYDSIYLDKKWVIKDYNQQVILTSHLRENDKLYII